ncbi:MAG TPA: TauD/TfdA family dioxygenase [Myxococcota bacterium]|nr:TauD/TfdA family dioxygenase [Myxococcota bacterium]
MEVRRYSSGCGALVRGIDLARFSDVEKHELWKAFLEHGVLFFVDQKLTPEDHIAFAERLGSIVINKFFPENSAHPEIAEVRKEKEQRTNIGGGWHADHSYDDAPALGSILVARELPDAGGDTMFANLYAAYDSLSEGLKRTLATLRAKHSNRHLYGAHGLYRKSDLAPQLKGEEGVGDAVHPAVITHPESGRKALYVNPGHTLHFEGWTASESQALLSYLYAHATKPEFTCRFRWSPGSVAFWDNRCTWHYAINDYHGERRLMHRITLEGTPLSAWETR